jgi:hypothetical protein
MNDISVLGTLKRDAFGEVSEVLLQGPGGERPGILRDVRDVRPVLRPAARILLAREARALRRLHGLQSVPMLLGQGPGFHVRSRIDGIPLEASASVPSSFWSSGRALLRALRRRLVTHNDTHKPENWILQPDGRAGLVDFQLAACFRRRSPWFRLCAREDLRHLLKQKRRYAPEALTGSERRLLGKRSWVAAFWRRSVKPAYRLWTRRVLRTRDGEGQGGSPRREASP